MSTHAFIGIEYKDNTIKGIYLHNDGYPEWTGVRLLRHFANLTDIEKLIDLGDLSVIGTEIGTPISFQEYIRDRNYHEAHENQCVAYHRDRGEDLTIRTYKSLKEAQDNGYESFNYIFNEKTERWHIYVWSSRKQDYKKDVLSTFMKREGLLDDTN